MTDTAVPPAAARGSRHPSLWRRTANQPDDWFDRQTLAEARAYARPLNRLRLVDTLIGVAVMVAIVLTEAAPELLEQLDLDGWALQLVAVLVALELVMLVVGTWIDGYVALSYDKRHGLSTQTPGSFAADVAKGVVLNIVLQAAIFVPLYAVMRRFDAWWLAGWAIFTGFMVLMGLLYPVVIMPRFNKFTPMPDGDLRRRIEVVAARSGETIEGVYTMDASKRTTRDNAFVAGFGPTKRVVVFDTMLEHPPEIIEQVVAHEIGHYRLKHLPKTLAFQTVVLLAVFAFLGWFTQWDWALDRAGVDDIGDPASLPLLLVGFGIAMKATTFLQAFYSRAKERQADLEALELLGDPDTFIDVWRRMAPKNKAELEPSFLRKLEHSHPEISERMAFGRQWGDENPSVTTPA